MINLPIELQQHIETITTDIGGLEGLETLLNKEDIIYLATYPSPIYVVTIYDYIKWTNREATTIDTVEPPIDLDKAGYIYDSEYTILDRNHKALYSASLQAGQYYGDNENDNLIFKLAASTISGCDYFFIQFYTANEYKIYPILVITKPTDIYYKNFLTQVRKLYQQKDNNVIKSKHNLRLETNLLFKYKVVHNNVTSFKDKRGQYESVILHQGDYLQSYVESFEDKTRVQLPNGLRVWVYTRSIELVYVDVYILPLSWKNAPSIGDVKKHQNTLYLRVNPTQSIHLNLTNDDTWLVIEQDNHLLSIKELIGSAFYAITEVTRGLYFIKPRTGKNITRYNLLQRNLNKADIEPLGVERISSSGVLDYVYNQTAYGGNIVGKTYIESVGRSLQPNPATTYLHSGKSSLVSRVHNIDTIDVIELDVIGSFTIGHNRNWFITDSDNLIVTILIWKNNQIIGNYKQEYTRWYGVHVDIELSDTGNKLKYYTEGAAYSIGIPEKSLIYSANIENDIPDKIEAFIYDYTKLYVIRYFDNYGIPTGYSFLPTNSVTITINIYSRDILLDTYTSNYSEWKSLYFLKTYSNQIELRTIGISLYDNKEIDSLLYTFEPDSIDIPNNIEVTTLNNATGESSIDYYSISNLEYREYANDNLDIQAIIYKDNDYCDIYQEQYKSYRYIYYKQIDVKTWELRIVGDAYSPVSKDVLGVDNLIEKYYGNKEDLPHKVEIRISSIVGETKNTLIFTYPLNEIGCIYINESNNGGTPTETDLDNIGVTRNEYTYINVYDIPIDYRTYSYPNFKLNRLYYKRINSNEWELRAIGERKSDTLGNSSLNYEYMIRRYYKTREELPNQIMVDEKTEEGLRNYSYTIVTEDYVIA